MKLHSFKDEMALLESFIQNDPGAFRSLYDIYYRQLFHYASRFIKEPDQVEDIISESFVIIWQKRQEFESLKSVAAYLYTVTRNACFSFLRKNRKKNSVFQELSYLTPHEDGDISESIKTDLLQFSLIAAQNLPREMKKVFQLIYIEGFSASEAAEKLNISIHTVKAQKANAVKRVRQTLIRKGLMMVFY